jgi:hypothetical protein
MKTLTPEIIHVEQARKFTQTYSEKGYGQNVLGCRSTTLWAVIPYQIWWIHRRISANTSPITANCGL